MKMPPRNEVVMLVSIVNSLKLHYPLQPERDKDRLVKHVIAKLEAIIEKLMNEGRHLTGNTTAAYCISRKNARRHNGQRKK